jgi:hypothetical protein
LQRPALQRNWFEPSSSAFQYTTPHGGFLRVWADTSFQFLPLPSVVAPLVVVGLVALGAISLFYDFRGRQLFRGFVEPVSFTLLLLGLSALIGAASLFGGYQILNRQWIASLLLMPTAFVWLAVAVGHNVKVLHPNAYKVLFLVIAVPIVLMGLYRGESRAQALVSAETNLQQIAATYPQINEGNAASFILGEPGAVAVANINLAVGGEVWSDFRVEGRPYVHACTTG